MKKLYPDWLRKAAGKGGKAKSDAKTAAARENGKKGGRPRLKLAKDLAPGDKLRAPSADGGIAVVTRIGEGPNGQIRIAALLPKSSTPGAQPIMFCSPEARIRLATD